MQKCELSLNKGYLFNDFDSKINMFSLVFNCDDYNKNDCVFKPNQRYKSWEHVRQEFYEFYINNVKENKKSITLNDKKHLALHLAFYLASWGMYRGSSFLLQNDYLIHVPIVEEILNAKYDVLWNYNPSNIEETEQVANLLFGTKDEIGLVKKIKNHYLFYKKSSAVLYDENDDSFVDDNLQTTSNELSEILVTKIIMGTFGCLPAYDRFFISGLKDKGVKSKLSKQNFLELIDVVNNNFISQINQFKIKKEFRNYTYMKFVDMYFWEHGYELDVKSWFYDVDKNTRVNKVEKFLQNNKTKTRTIKKINAIKLRFERDNKEDRCDLQNDIIDLCDKFLSK